MKIWRKKLPKNEPTLGKSLHLCNCMVYLIKTQQSLFDSLSISFLGTKVLEATGRLDVCSAGLEVVVFEAVDIAGEDVEGVAISGETVTALTYIRLKGLLAKLPSTLHLNRGIYDSQLYSLF